ncbi:Gfo/Idh/MocA family protein [Cohnella thailandensis]|uniref:Gfo/Idh/MocA family oxidoreductase n=1 Tax=Cohnella thailandensis TaxID=557557 RepID=A0A841SYJ7_9BACL|nr:Gfo/Idh/MocA family oxidoreductase [Cohnella thailandensis]MBB6635979.1 Gfo/Idh/MocA family oxidoreductase [Cohnella thailandensis]MBP1976357.1 putative dehydrogenase [Cohnella thailandensis]
MRKLKIGMLSFAHSHAFDYLDSLLRMRNVEVAGIADEAPERTKELAARHSIPYYADYRDLLADASVEAVVICSENVRHAELTIASAKAGKHVLCEKPLGLGAEEMESMIAACKEAGVELMTAFPCRYLTPVVRAKEALERGEIGEILSFKATNRGSFPDVPWFSDKSLSGGGAVLDHTVHVMDLMNWFTGSNPASVYAYAATLFDPEGKRTIDDAGMVHVTFENGVSAVLDPSWSRNPGFPTWGDVTMDIIGTKGVISIDAFNQKNSVYSRKSGKGDWAFWGDDMNALMLEAFVTAILEGKPVPVTGEDGLRSARVALRAYDSVEAGSPVKV